MCLCHVPLRSPEQCDFPKRTLRNIYELDPWLLTDHAEAFAWPRTHLNARYNLIIMKYGSHLVFLQLWIQVTKKKRRYLSHVASSHMHTWFVASYVFDPWRTSMSNGSDCILKGKDARHWNMIKEWKRNSIHWDAMSLSCATSTNLCRGYIVLWELLS